jgi:lysophospholipase L1-like esterase
MRYLTFIIFIVFAIPVSFGQNNFSDDIGKSIFADTFFLTEEMSAYLDTSFLNRYEEEIVKYEQEDIEKGIEKGQILFYGSSSFRKWTDLKKDMFPLRVINRGFGGSTLPEAVYYFNRMVIPYQPAAIVLYEGDNDILAPFLTPEVILETFKLFFDLCKKYLPDTKIFFVSIKPSPSRIAYHEKMRLTNQLIKEFCETDNQLYYIDITEKMYNYDGSIREDIFLSDKLHLNQKGYEIWSEIIRKSLIRIKI